MLEEDAHLQRPPENIPATDLLPAKLPSGWDDGVTTAASLSEALSEQYGQPLPWATVRQAINGAFQAAYMKRTVDSGAWPTDRAGAEQVKIQLPEEGTVPKPAAGSQYPKSPPESGFSREPGVRYTSADLEVDEIQNLADEVSELVNAAAAYGIRFHLRIEAGADEPLPEGVAARLNEILAAISEKLQFGEAAT